jgi:hypothetical protein
VRNWQPIPVLGAVPVGVRLFVYGVVYTPIQRQKARDHSLYRQAISIQEVFPCQQADGLETCAMR